MQLRPAILALLFAGCATSRTPALVAVGDPLVFELPDLKGARTSPADLRGKVVLVDLWATWCEPCKVSLPFYKALFEQHAKEGFAVVAVSVDVHADDVAAFLQAEELPFVVLHDPGGTLPRKIGIEALPTMVLLGRDGKIAYLHPGFVPEDKEAIAGEVERALSVVTSTAASAVAPGDAPR